MAKRKQYIVDKKFQLKTTFTVLGFKIVIVSLLTAIIALNALDINRRASNINSTAFEINERIENIVDIQDGIVAALTYADVDADEHKRRMSVEMARNHATNMQNLRDTIKENQDIIAKNQGMMRKNQVLLWIIVAIIAIQAMVLFFVLIIHTHRIAGPIYVMSLYMRQMINGKFPDSLRPLRDKDFLKDFYELFGQMIEAVRSGKVK